MNALNNFERTLGSGDSRIHVKIESGIIEVLLPSLAFPCFVLTVNISKVNANDKPYKMYIIYIYML